MKKKYDVVVVGGGPGGLSAAINAASEGLNTILIDSKNTLGGQAKKSSSIENYPGFPNGISGTELTSLFSVQSNRFGVEFLRPTVARGIVRTEEGLIVSTDDDNRPELITKTVILAPGLSYRKLSAEGVDAFIGHGVMYNPGPADLRWLEEGLKVTVIGGSNSAGQAAVYLAGLGHDVTMLVRGSLEVSDYLRKKIIASGVTVLTDSELKKVSSVPDEPELNLIVQYNEERVTLGAHAICIYIGASPKTYWLNGIVDRTDKGYIVTGENGLLPFETSMDSVFAIGDVREGSVKRVAAAVGEGSVVVQQVLKRISTL